MLRIILLTCLLPNILWGQQIHAPLQDERLRLAACLHTIETLPPTYRTHMARACVDIPLKVCSLRGRARACLIETLLQMQQDVTAIRAALPNTVQGTAFKATSYRLGLARIEAAFAPPIPPTAPLADLTQLYSTRAAATVDAFYRARMAGVSLKGVL